MNRNILDLKNFISMKRVLLIILTLFIAISTSLIGQKSTELRAKVDKLAAHKKEKVVEWRRHFHQYPELSNREFKTAEKVAAHLKALGGMEVRTGIAHTGVIGVLKGGKPGKVVALRADMDALPVVERNDLSFKSEVKSTYNGQDVGVMHACGHDTHIAILMGVAEVLSELRKELPGTVVFIFQPAEEGAPRGEEGGAKLMLEEGAFDNPKPDVVFGLHINSLTEVGKIKYVPRGTMAAADFLRIKVKGTQTHGGYPWNGNDPVVLSAQIINGLQTIVSRHTTLLKAPAVVTVATIHGGVRNNIIPEVVEMTGTIRTLDTQMQETIHKRIKMTAEKIAESAGARAEVEIIKGYPVTYNDPDLVDKMLPSIQRAAGADNVMLGLPVTGAEDFSYFSKEVPGFYFFLGGRPKNTPLAAAAPHHTPEFIIDDSKLDVGVRALAYMSIDYMFGG